MSEHIHKTAETVGFPLVAEDLDFVVKVSAKPFNNNKPKDIILEFARRHERRTSVGIPEEAEYLNR